MDEADVAHRVVLKLRKTIDTSIPWHRTLSRELVGAILGRVWGFPVPQYSVVAITEAFVESLRESPAEFGRMGDNRGYVFGSGFIEPALDDLPGDVDSWEGTMQFDAFCFNADRKRENPNVVWDGETVFLIDHGLVAPTWEFDAQGFADGELYGNDRIGSHAGYPVLLRAGRPYDRMEAWAQDLEDEMFNFLRHAMPEEWASDQEFDRIRVFLRERGQVASEQGAQLREVLT